MRQIAIAIIFLFFFVIATTFAQGQGTNEVISKFNSTPTISDDQSISATNINILSWSKKNPIDWSSGVIFALSGLIGALVTIFGLIGTAVPGTAGQVSIEEDCDRLRSLCQKQDIVLKETGNINVNEADILQKAVGDLRDDISKERWRQFGIAAFMYAVIGAFFAAFLAQDALQALMIGAGWTGVMGSLGLKRDYEERSSKKNNAINELQKRVDEQNKKINEQSDEINRLKGKSSEGSVPKESEEQKAKRIKDEQIRHEAERAAKL